MCSGLAGLSMHGMGREGIQESQDRIRDWGAGDDR